MKVETAPQPPPAKKDTKPQSVINWTLLVPLSAVAAYALTGPSSQVEAPPTPTSNEAPTTAVTTNPVVSDIEEACGTAGVALVNAEAGGTITDVQQAALTALRDICELQGIPLPPAAPPSDGAGLVVQNSNPDPSPAPSVSQSRDDDDHHEDDHDDDDDDDHEEDD
jgi:hypothetical protein